MAGKPHCNFIGHLENEPTACVAVTGCYGVDNVEFTIKSRHLLSGNSFVMDPNGTLKEILNEDEEELLYDYIEDDDDEEIDVDDYSSEQRMLTTRPEGMPEKSKLTLKVCKLILEKSVEDYFTDLDRLIGSFDFLKDVHS